MRSEFENLNSDSAAKLQLVNDDKLLEKTFWNLKDTFYGSLLLRSVQLLQSCVANLLLQTVYAVIR